MSQNIGLPPRNRDTLDYQGRPLSVTPTTQAPRDPSNTSDLKYAIQTIWRNTVNNNEWMLVGFSGGQAIWRMFQFGVGTLSTLTGNSGGAVGPSAGNINVVGDNTSITIVGNPGTNTLTVSTVGGPPNESFTVQATTAPGVNPVVPSGGTITVNGAAVAAHSVPVETRTRAANTYNIETQLTAISTFAARTINNAGLASFDSSNFTIDAATGFIQLVGGAGPAALSITGDTGGAVGPNGTGTIFDRGATTTYVIGNAGTNTIKAEVVSTANTFLLGAGPTTASTTIGPLTNGQLIIGSTGVAPVAAALTAGSGITITNGAGSISIAASSAVTETLTGDSGGALSPSGNNFNILGQTVTNATNAKPVFVAGSGSTETVQVQVATTSTSGAKSINNAGLASFNSAQFTVDAPTGFISLAGLATGAIEGVLVDAHSGSGTSPVVPSSGDITITGAQVASGVVGTNVIRSDSTTANSLTIEIQRTTTSVGSDVTKNGVSHFNSAQFTVDANGFVTSTTTANVVWSDKAVNYSAVSNNGYMSTAVVTGSLPAAGQPNGTTIDFIATTSDAHTIAPATTDKIRIGNVLSTNGTGGGKIVSTSVGNSIQLVYQSSSGIWQALSNNGNWTVV